MNVKKSHEWFISKLYKIHPNIFESYVFLIKYKGSTEKVHMYGKYGEVAIAPPVLFSGSKPSILSAINKNEYFINQCAEIYGDKYSYNKVNYSGAKSEIILTCNEHGDFKTTPSNLFLGHGCPMCNLYHYNTILALNNKKQFGKINAKVYIIKMFNDSETFYKIGITKHSINYRFKKMKEYNYEVVAEIKTNLYKAIFLENLIHNNLSKYSYIPNQKFDGYTECFSQIDDIIIEDCYNQLDSYIAKLEKEV